METNVRTSKKNYAIIEKANFSISVQIRSNGYGEQIHSYLVEYTMNGRSSYVSFGNLSCAIDFINLTLQKMNKISEHFSYYELVNSSTAERLGINNTPDADSICNLKKLCNTVLEPLRALVGHPIHINSGYRCLALNKAVGGVSNSDHMFGCAVDIPYDAYVFKVLFSHRELFNIRQLIHENYRGNEWIHISIPRP